MSIFELQCQTLFATFMKEYVLTMDSVFLMHIQTKLVVDVCTTGEIEPTWIVEVWKCHYILIPLKIYIFTLLYPRKTEF